MPEGQAQVMDTAKDGQTGPGHWHTVWCLHQGSEVHLGASCACLALGANKAAGWRYRKDTKIAFKIILGGKYVSYQLACKMLSAQTLEMRRIKLCLKFGKKNLKSENCLFTKITTNVNTRQKSDLVKEYKCNKGHFQKSSLPFLAKLINIDNRTRKYVAMLTIPL